MDLMSRIEIVSYIYLSSFLNSGVLAIFFQQKVLRSLLLIVITIVITVYYYLLRILRSCCYAVTVTGSTRHHFALRSTIINCSIYAITYETSVFFLYL